MSRVAVAPCARLSLKLAATLLLAIAALAMLAEPADARWKRKGFFTRAAPAASATTDARYAHVVIDAKTGATLHAANADATRHPASLTKIMTLYMLFEQLEAGKLKLDSKMEVSAEAASQAPTKLGLRAGQTLSVEDAIRGLVTKSANDASVVIAETLAADEEEFAKLMTRKARALGMSRTTYKNASGLPDDDQITTARDQALLGMAIQDRFPQYYRYFATSNFRYNGRAMANHNRLLGRVAGVDGIKTGYTRMSGFNLVTSMRRGNRHVVAVVLGGRSAGLRDARMRSLLEENVAQASNNPGGKIAVAALAASANGGATRVKPLDLAEMRDDAPRPAKRMEASIEPVRADAAEPRVAKAKSDAAAAPATGSTDPIQPRLVKTLSVKPRTVQVASLAGTPPEAAKTLPAPVATDISATGSAMPAGARPGVLGVLPAKSAAIEPMPMPMPRAEAPARAEPPASVASVSSPRATPVAAPAKTVTRTGWMIQVGAFDVEAEARTRLNAVKGQAGKWLKDAEPFTETVTKDDKTLYRARFAGIERDEAEAACRSLKRSSVPCIAFKN